MASRLPGAAAASTPGGSRRRSPRLQGSENSAQSADVPTKSGHASSGDVDIAHKEVPTSVNQAEAGAALPDGAQAAIDDDSRMAASSTRNAGAAVRPLGSDSDSDDPSGSQIRQDALLSKASGGISSAAAGGSARRRGARTKAAGVQPKLQEAIDDERLSGLEEMDLCLLNETAPHLSVKLCLETLPAGARLCLRPGLTDNCVEGSECLTPTGTVKTGSGTGNTLCGFCKCVLQKSRRLGPPMASSGLNSEEELRELFVQAAKPHRQTIVVGYLATSRKSRQLRYCSHVLMDAGYFAIPEGAELPKWSAMKRLDTMQRQVLLALFCLSVKVFGDFPSSSAKDKKARSWIRKGPSGLAKTLSGARYLQESARSISLDLYHLSPYNFIFDDAHPLFDQRFAVVAVLRKRVFESKLVENVPTLLKLVNDLPVQMAFPLVLAFCSPIRRVLLSRSGRLYICSTVNEFASLLCTCCLFPMLQDERDTYWAGLGLAEDNAWSAAQLAEGHVSARDAEEQYSIDESYEPEESRRERNDHMSYEFGSLSGSEQTCAAMLLHLCGLQEPPVSDAEEKRSSVKLASDESHGSAYAWMNYDTDASGADADSGTGSVASTAVDQEERFDPGGTDSQHSDASSDNGARLEKLRRAEKGRRKRSVRFAPKPTSGRRSARDSLQARRARPKRGESKRSSVQARLLKEKEQARADSLKASQTIQRLEAELELAREEEGGRKARGRRKGKARRKARARRPAEFHAPACAAIRFRSNPDDGPQDEEELDAAGAFFGRRGNPASRERRVPEAKRSELAAAVQRNSALDAGTFTMGRDDGGFGRSAALTIGSDFQESCRQSETLRTQALTSRQRQEEQVVTGGLWGGRRSTGGHYVEDDDGPPTIESRENSVRKMTEVRAEEGGANMELPPALRLQMVERQEIRIKDDGRMVKVNLETMAFTPEKQMSTKFPQVDSLRACEEDYKCWNDYCEMLIGKFTRQLTKMRELREIPYDPEYDLPTAAEQYCVDKIEHYTGMKNFMYEHWVCFAQKKLRTAMAHSSPADRAKGVMRVFNYMNAVRRLFEVYRVALAVQHVELWKLSKRYSVPAPKKSDFKRYDTHSKRFWQFLVAEVSATAEDPRCRLVTGASFVEKLGGKTVVSAQTATGKVVCLYCSKPHRREACNKWMTETAEGKAHVARVRAKRGGRTRSQDKKGRAARLAGK